MKQIKRILSILLAAVLLLGSISVAVSADTEIDETASYPLVKMTGSWGNLYEMNPDGTDGPMVFEAGDGIMNLLTEDVTAKLLERAKALDLNGVVDMAVDILHEYFGPIAMDETGTSIYPVGRVAETGSRNGDGAWYFHFDWRLDPMDLADLLNAHIDNVLAQESQMQGKTVDKVNISCLSGSGQVLMSYLVKYGSDKLASAVFNLSMQSGSSFFGDLFKGNVGINVDIIGKLDRIILFGNPINLGEMIPWIGWLYEPGILGLAEKLIALLGKGLINRIYEEALLPLLCQIPGWWAYVPQADYEAAKKFVFKGDAKFNVLKTKMDIYRETVVKKNDEIMKELAGKIKVAVRASYGNPLIPLGRRSYVQADAMVDTAYASFGATCAPFNSPFNSLYKTNKNHNKCSDPTHAHISPDRMIDAATCLLPEQTWFALNQFHTTQYEYSGWYRWFLETKNPTVSSNKDYPQYAEYLEDTDEFVPLVITAERTWKDTLAAIGYWLLKAWRWILLLPLFWI